MSPHDHSDEGSLPEDSTSKTKPDNLDEGPLPRDLTSEIKPDEHYFAYGAYSEVYGGDWTDPSRGGEMTRVAIKSLRGITDDEGLLVKIRKRFLREIRVWMPLEHPNITPFLGAMTGFGPLAAMVSPYYSKGNINQYTLDNPNTDKLPLITGVAKGLAYLHSLNILHGDLKGHNVLMDDNLSPRLADFGRSRIAERRGFTTAFTGTGRYMAPELTVISDDLTDPIPATYSSEGDTPDSAIPAVLDPLITKKSDIYAFAMVVIEILTSKLPFFYLRQEHLVVILTQDGHRPDRLRCLPTQFSDDIWRFMEDCWHHDPQARPEMSATIPRLEEMQSKNLRVAWEEAPPQ